MVFILNMADKQRDVSVQLLDINSLLNGTDHEFEGPVVSLPM